MKIATREWGTLEIEESTVIHMADGLLGFEDLHRFVFIDAEEFRPFVWFLSIDDPEVGFAVAEPFYFSNAPYDVQLSAGDEAGLELEEGDEIAIFVLVAIEDKGRSIAGNLKGPIVLNTRNRQAKQVVVYGSSYSVRQPILNRRIVPLHRAVGGPAARTDAAA
jgi:flagellar assembly factor FliW